MQIDFTGKHVLVTGARAASAVELRGCPRRLSLRAQAGPNFGVR